MIGQDEQGLGPSSRRDAHWQAHISDAHEIHHCPLVESKPGRPGRPEHVPGPGGERDLQTDIKVPGRDE